MKKKKKKKLVFPIMSLIAGQALRVWVGGAHWVGVLKTWAHNHFVSLLLFTLRLHGTIHKKTLRINQNKIFALNLVALKFPYQITHAIS